MEDCIFCKIAAGEIPGDIQYEDETVLAFKDISPVAPVHILIIPKKHLSSLADVSEADAGLLGKLMLIGRSLAKENGLAEDGYRLVLNTGLGAGQTVFHLHLHLLGGRKMTWPPG